MKRVVVVLGLMLCVASAQAGRKDWKVGVQAYSFRKFTFAETLDELEKMGVNYLEIYPGQRLGGGLEGKTHHAMDEATRSKVLDMAAAKGVKIVSYGCVKAKDEAGWREIYGFAKAMGIATIVSEPKLEDMPLLDKLCGEYGIQLAIHNHLTPTPDEVLERMEGCCKLVGGSPDNGHWCRAGFDNLESLKKYEGRVLSIHMKDIDKPVKEGQTVPFGTGVIPMQKVFAELDRQGYSGPVIIEYESEKMGPAESIAKCVRYVDQYIKTGSVP